MHLVDEFTMLGFLLYIVLSFYFYNFVHLDYDNHVVVCLKNWKYYNAAKLCCVKSFTYLVMFGTYVFCVQVYITIKDCMHSHILIFHG